MNAVTKRHGSTKLFFLPFFFRFSDECMKEFHPFFFFFSTEWFETSPNSKPKNATESGAKQR